VIKGDYTLCAAVGERSGDQRWLYSLLV